MVVKGFTPHKDQRLKIDLMEKPGVKFIILTTGRQWGKTLLGQNMLLKWALENTKSRSMWVSPVYSQAKKVFDTLVQAVGGTAVVKGINRSELRISFINGSSIIFRSGERADTLRGNTVDYLVVDEAAFIKDDVWNMVLKQTTMVKGKKVLFISTPKGKNFLFDLNLRGESSEYPTYLSLRGTSFDTPFISEDELIDAKRVLPDDIYRQEILGEFVDDGGEVFKDIHTYCVLPEFNYVPGTKYYGGLDLGRSNDYTVLTIFNENGDVAFMYRERQKPWDTIVGEVVNIVKKYNCQLQVEVNNIGDVIFEQIKKQHQNTHPFVTTNSSKQNIIEDLIYNLSEGNIRLPSAELFEPLSNEMKAFTFTYSPRTRSIRYEAQQGHHDDTIMSMAIALNTMKSKKTMGSYYVY
tara:strand:+ start:1599 stop:2822 length:1224 start_codon:yes stop_codon:yes gene_type:complete